MKQFDIYLFMFIIIILFLIFFLLILNLILPLILTTRIVYNILTKEECAQIINECETINKWTMYNSDGYCTHDILLKDLPNIYDFMEKIIYSKIAPKFFNLDKDKLFIIKYFNENASHHETYHEIKETGYHQDDAPFSFNIALNDDFTGGGTHFLNEKKYINNPTGSCLFFSGKNIHSGIKINSGVRYIIYGSFY
jgi:hypothetical protein